MKFIFVLISAVVSVASAKIATPSPKTKYLILEETLMHRQVTRIEERGEQSLCYNEAVRAYPMKSDPLKGDLWLQANQGLQGPGPCSKKVLVFKFAGNKNSKPTTLCGENPSTQNWLNELAQACGR